MGIDKGLLEITRQEVWDKYHNPVYTVPERIGRITTQYKISICTTCMGRTEDLKKTYIQNLDDNLGYGNIEFVLLNYGSRDDMDTWVFQNLMEYIQGGVVNYYRTDEPIYYSMTHSRNIAFKVATGDIINNVDADHYTNPDFVRYINALANTYETTKVVFVKSKQKNRGRVGIFKKEFMELGGYDESLEGYGHDDQDLLLRAYHSGCGLIKFGGEYMRITDDHARHPVGNYQVKDWRYTQRRNALISLLNIYMKRFKANENHPWGRAHLVKNFSEEVDT